MVPHTDFLDRLLVTLAVQVRSFSICRVQKGWRLGFSAFEAITIHYVLQGAGSLQVGKGRWEPFGPDTVLIVPAAQPHVLGEAVDVLGEARSEDHCTLHGDGMVAFTAGDGSADILLACGQISASHLGALGLFGLFQAPLIEAFPPHSVVQRSFELMLAEVASPSLGTQAMTEALMKQCLIALLRRHLLMNVGTSPLLAALHEPKLAPAVLTVLEQPGAAYSVESLAALSGMSRTSFAERFSAMFGQGPMDFVQGARLRVAARLLGSTDLPVKVIANSVGYESRSAFSRAFEAAYQVPPKEYRKLGGGGGDAERSARQPPIRGARATSDRDGEVGNIS